MGNVAQPPRGPDRGIRCPNREIDKGFDVRDAAWLKPVFGDGPDWVTEIGTVKWAPISPTYLGVGCSVERNRDSLLQRPQGATSATRKSITITVLSFTICRRFAPFQPSQNLTGPTLSAAPEYSDANFHRKFPLITFVAIDRVTVACRRASRRQLHVRDPRVSAFGPVSGLGWSRYFRKAMD